MNFSNRLTAALAISSLLFAIGLSAANATSNSVLLDKKFSNCAALTKVYPGGVAKSAKSVNKGGKITNTPTVNAAVYSANAGKDRDKDGIACEN